MRKTKSPEPAVARREIAAAILATIGGISIVGAILTFPAVNTSPAFWLPALCAAGLTYFGLMAMWLESGRTRLSGFSFAAAAILLTAAGPTVAQTDLARFLAAYPLPAVLLFLASVILLSAKSPAGPPFRHRAPRHS